MRMEPPVYQYQTVRSIVLLFAVSCLSITNEHLKDIKSCSSLSRDNEGISLSTVDVVKGEVMPISEAGNLSSQI